MRPSLISTNPYWGLKLQETINNQQPAKAFVLAGLFYLY